MKDWDVLVTGSAGFVGRYMVDELEQRGATVYTLDLKVEGDMQRLLPQIDKRFDLVIHLAYHVGGRRAIDGSPMNLAANATLDAVLFDWALRTRQKQVLYFSSSAAYPIHLQNGKRPILLEETMIEYGKALEPDANYGWAKLTGERMAYAAMASGLPVHIVRPFSGYAPDQDLDYPFPSLVKRVRERQKQIEVWGSADQTRDWIHIIDVVKGALAVVESEIGVPVNLCTGIATSMSKLVRLMCREIGHKPDIKVLADMPMGVMHRVGDPALFYRIYTPRISIDQSVQEAMRWTSPAAKPRR